jgi:ATP-binding cassette, subfamily C (CFTR/MRP), member 1
LWRGKLTVVVSTVLNEKIAAKMGPAKMAWNQGVQERVSATSSMLSQMKGIKMTGLAGFFSQHVQGLRDEEIKLSKTYRVAVIYIQFMGKLPLEETVVRMLT